jgi:serine/threonine protein kinase
VKQAMSSGHPSAGFVPLSVGELAGYFPQLEILQLLGRGGMGAVYQARQPLLDRWVALKILRADFGRDPAFAERFVREARALARLSHPNIVAVYDFGQSDSLYYFLMEYVDGVNLRRLMQEGRLTPEMALKMVPQICEALEYAHNEAIVHRDIKPENLLLDHKGQVKIADFGLAKLLGSDENLAHLTGTGEVMGTYQYMAPEQMQHPSAVDHRADIYSLGVVFYEMLTGELPLGRFQSPSQRVHIDVRLDEVVLRALETKPERRYQHAAEVKAEVDNILAKPKTDSFSPSAPSTTTAASPSLGTTGQATGPWRPRPSRAVQGLLNVLLFVAFVICLLQFLDYRESVSHRAQGLSATHHFQIGSPSPWFEAEKDTSGVALHFYWISWAWVVAAAGALACQLLWQQVKPANSRLHRLGPPGCLLWTLIIFLAFATIVTIAFFKSV